MKKLLGVILSAALFLSAFGTSASAETTSNISELPLPNITATGQTIQMPMEEFTAQLNVSENLKDSAKFSRLQAQRNTTVTLTPEDLLKLCIYSGNDEYIDWELAELQGKRVTVQYNGDGAYVLYPEPERVMYGDRNQKISVTRTAKLRKLPVTTTSKGFGTDVEVTATFNLGWTGGSQAFAEYLSHTTHAKSVRGYDMDTIVDSKVTHSSGKVTNGKAWVKYTCKGQHSGSASVKIDSSMR